MIRPHDRQLAQQIEINLMGGMPLPRPRHAIDQRDAYQPHQRRYLPLSNAMAFTPEDIPEHPDSGERILQMEFIDLAHERQRRV